MAMGMYKDAKRYFDLNNKMIMHKVNHTYRVVNNAKYICEDMELDDEDKDLAMVIALLHDIGRFDQAKQMKTFREDITNYDHATLGVKLLFEQNEIRNFIPTAKYDEIIKKAIANHSKYILDESGMTDWERLHAKIIRDADKIDSFSAKTTDDIQIMANITEQDIEESKITDKVFEDFMKEKTIFSKDRKTGIDIWVSYIAFVFGLEFNSSLKLIKEKDYVNQLFNRFNYKMDFEKMNRLRDKANDYLNSRLL